YATGSPEGTWTRPRMVPTEVSPAEARREALDGSAREREGDAGSLAWGAERAGGGGSLLAIGGGGAASEALGRFLSARVITPARWRSRSATSDSAARRAWTWASS